MCLQSIARAIRNLGDTLVAQRPHRQHPFQVEVAPVPFAPRAVTFQPSSPHVSANRRSTPMTVTNAASGTRVHEIAPGIHRISTPVPPTRPFPRASRSTSFSSSTTNPLLFPHGHQEDVPARRARRWPTSSVTSPGFAGCLRGVAVDPLGPSHPREAGRDRAAPPSRSCTGAASGATGQRCSWRWPTRWGCEAGGATIPAQRPRGVTDGEADGRRLPFGRTTLAPRSRPVQERETSVHPCPSDPIRPLRRAVRRGGRDFAVVLESLQGDFHVFGEALQGPARPRSRQTRRQGGQAKLARVSHGSGRPL